jgi:hypothetical protein
MYDRICDAAAVGDLQSLAQWLDLAGDALEKVVGKVRG